MGGSKGNMVGAKTMRGTCQVRYPRRMMILATTSIAKPLDVSPRIRSSLLADKRRGGLRKLRCIYLIRILAGLLSVSVS